MRARPAAAALIGALIVAACSAPGRQQAQPDACGLDSDAIGSFVRVPGGAFMSGAAPVYPEEGPAMRLHVAAFELLSHEVTNAEFARFVEATGYVTDAERSVAQGREGAGSAVFGRATATTVPGWRLDPDASWRAPEGAGSDLSGRETHPVVHVSYRDAEAYAQWAGARLPEAVELEYAATLGLPDASRAESGAYGPDGRPLANTWQGVFPVANTVEDGFAGTAPVGCFGADRLGAHDLIGNVWEWTRTPYAPDQHTLKGGSFLCAANFCRRYRPAARQPQDTDFSSNHTGFRIVRDIDPDS